MDDPINLKKLDVFFNGYTSDTDKEAVNQIVKDTCNQIEKKIVLN